jgi:hypothetical protein
MEPVWLQWDSVFAIRAGNKKGVTGNKPMPVEVNMKLVRWLCPLGD